MGRLRYVLSPEATEIMKNAVNTQTISDLCYTYSYDSGGRLATKRLPGAAEKWFVYDGGDRLAMSSDGNLRAAGQWIYYQYDALGRIAEQGRFAASYATQSAAQQAFNGTFSGSAFDIKYQYDSYTGVPAALAISEVANDLRVKGLKTYESIRVLNPAAGEPQTIDRAFYYDAKGRVVQTVATNVKGGVDRTTMTYNWAGDLLTTTETHSYTGGSNTLVTTATYDRTGKPLTQSVAADGSVTASNTFTYDDLNRTAGKTYGTLSETLSYNVQGWLTGISSSKFTQTLTYFPTYKNGNIASTQWQHGTGQSNTYSFVYDQLNRLTGASGYAFTEQGITYDKNGNIKSLQRTANNLTIENLSYTYSGNKLSSVNESVTGGMTSTYTYDANGNLAADSKKALNFSYNFLNLLSTAGTTNYCYAADGTKLAVRDASGNGFAYLGSLMLSPSSTEFQFADGVIRKTTSGYEVNYFLKDHLGSVRTVVNAAGDAVQQSDYYPFGSKHENATYVNNSNRFLYNGKELQTTGNLGFLDYGARMYDAKLGRWFVQDNLAEKYTAFSPYNYVLNNPLRFIDPDGTNPVVIGGALFTVTELALISTGIITTGIILQQAKDGSIEFTPEVQSFIDEGFNWQEKQERRAKEKLDQSQANVQKGINDYIGSPSPDGTPDPKREPKGQITKVALISAFTATIIYDFIHGTNPDGTKIDKPIVKPNDTKLPESPLEDIYPDYMKNKQYNINVSSSK